MDIADEEAVSEGGGGYDLRWLGGSFISCLRLFWGVFLEGGEGILAWNWSSLCSAMVDLVSCRIQHWYLYPRLQEPWRGMQ